ncbi:hypothetical protein SHIRM173S_01603 [Streptomyces hirsutus]
MSRAKPRMTYESQPPFIVRPVRSLAQAPARRVLRRAAQFGVVGAVGAIPGLDSLAAQQGTAVPAGPAAPPRQDLRPALHGIRVAPAEGAEPAQQSGVVQSRMAHSSERLFPPACR